MFSHVHAHKYIHRGRGRESTFAGDYLTLSRHGRKQEQKLETERQRETGERWFEVSRATKTKYSYICTCVGSVGTDPKSEMSRAQSRAVRKLDIFFGPYRLSFGPIEPILELFFFWDNEGKWDTSACLKKENRDMAIVVIIIIIWIKSFFFFYTSGRGFSNLSFPFEEPGHMPSDHQALGR